MVLSTLGRYLRQKNIPEQQLVQVKVEAPPEPGSGFVLMPGNGRRIASGSDDATVVSVHGVAATWSGQE